MRPDNKRETADEIDRLDDAIRRAARLLSLCDFDQPADLDDLEFVERVSSERRPQ